MNRRCFIKKAGLTALSLPLMNLTTLDNLTKDYNTTPKMPVMFLAHGHPINAILDNDFTRTLSGISSNIEKPNAIMVVSAHWETKGTYVSVNPYPKTIYDFGNFDSRLFDIKYEPQGHPTLANEVREINSSILEHHEMGLDHGAWTVLKHIYPKADIPVFQLSIDYSKGANYHYELAKQLKSLRRKGVLIIGSGNIVHNLGRLNWSNQNVHPYDWALEFDYKVKQKLAQQQFADLINHEKMGNSALLSIPTNEHYLPMLYILGLMEEGETIQHIYEGYEFGAISMRSFKID
jgi:4,5-DOPA dioxygenase extradiol